MRRQLTVKQTSHNTFKATCTQKKEASPPPPEKEFIEIKLRVEKELFRFDSPQDFTQNSFEKFLKHEVQAHQIYILDAKNRICSVSKDLDRAERENAYPLICYTRI